MRLEMKYYAKKREMLFAIVCTPKKKQAKQDAEQKDERMNMKLIFPPAKEELQDIKALECLNDELEEGEINDDLMITDNAKG